MKDLKNYVIAALLAVIALLAITQPAQSAAKSPSQVQLINYQACVNAAFEVNTKIIVELNGGNGETSPRDFFIRCKFWLTQNP